MPLDPDVAAFLATIDANGFDELLPTGPSARERDEALRRLRNLRRPPIDPDDTVTTQDVTTGDGVALRVYRSPAADGTEPVVMYLHGGGWVLGDLDTHDHLCRYLARSGAQVVSVDYRLAPEHPFPAALDDAASALDWVTEGWSDVSTPRVVVMGTSAGGNLTAALALREAAKSANRIAAQVLAYPVLDSRMGTPSYTENANGYHLTALQMAWFWQQYLADADRTDPLASPTHARSLHGLPPTVIVTAEYDPLRDEGADFAARLSAAGVAVEYVPVPGVIHGFLAMADQFPIARSALDDVITRIKRLASPPGQLATKNGAE
jgi:acetyl esterase